MIQLREALPTDDAFLFALFAENKGKEFAVLGLNPSALQALLELQFRSRAESYGVQWPGATQFIVLTAQGARAGQFLLHRQETALRLVDLAIAEPHRGVGLGSAVLRHLQAIATDGGQPLQLQVDTRSPARRLYQRLGFEPSPFQPSPEGMLSVEMVWHPPALPVRQSQRPLPSPVQAPQPLPALDKSCVLFTTPGSGPAQQPAPPPRDSFVPRNLGEKYRGGSPATLRSALLLVASLAGALIGHAQGILTLTPGRTTGTVAGTGTPGYSGDGGSGPSASLAAPSAVAYDTAGNLYIADANNHVIREVVKGTGSILTVAGNGTAGFSGDGAAATAAQLDTPTGIALDASGNLFIADSHNQRIREVSAGTITTVAGNGTAGFSGDGAAATLASLHLPSAVALDAAGTLYIADTDNQRIRRISAGTITTLAGSGEQAFAGDGGPALDASLDTPTGVAVDTAGNLYIADRHNHRIRLVNSSGVITTLAGTGTVNFTGSFSGEGSAASTSALAKPTGVSVDAAGNIYVTDTNNQRIRQITGGTIATVAGNGDQGVSPDGTSSVAAALNAPRATATDANGNLALADTLNQRVRADSLSMLTFASAAVGVPAAPQLVTLSNTGSSPLMVASATATGAFTVGSGGSCGAAPITLAPGASCTESIAFVPTMAGANSGAITFRGSGILPQTILLSGSGAQASSATTLTASVPASLLGENILLTASVTSAGAATGNVTFFASGVPLGTATISAGYASLTTQIANAGTYNLTAIYSGDANFGGSTSPALTEYVGDFNFAITPGAGGSTTQTVPPGQTAVFSLGAAPLNGPFSFPITLTATGLPPGATVSFAPSTLTLGSSPVSFTMSVQTSRSTASLRHLEGLGGTTLALFLLPFAGRLRRGSHRLKPLFLSALCLASLSAVAGLTGCGASSGFFGQPLKTYTINVVATANGANGATLQHAATVQLTVQ